MEDKKILMLTMSCNDPYYQALLGAVRNTWAKPLIQNKYPNIIWFSYTSCDEKHPVPVVDFENHMIYVDCPDDIKHTYQKTYDAYHMIKNIIDFDYVVRTNTSTFINIDNMLKRFDEIWSNNSDSVIGIFEEMFENHVFIYWIVYGYFFAMKKEFFEYCVYDRFVNYNEHMDDVIFSKNLQKFLGDDYDGKSITKNAKIPWYKPNSHLSIYKSEFESRPCCFVPTYDPEIVNDSVIIRLRPPYDFDRRTTTEIANMYELNEHLKYDE